MATNSNLINEYRGGLVFGKDFLSEQKYINMYENDL